MNWRRSAVRVSGSSWVPSSPDVSGLSPCGRVVLMRAGEHGERGQVARLRRCPRGPYDAAEHLALGEQGVAVPDRGSRHQFGYGGVGVGQHGGGHVQQRVVVMSLGLGRAVQGRSRSPAALPVEHTDDEPYRRIQTAGQQGRGHVGLVVAVGEGERRGPLHPGGPQGVLVRARGHQQLDRRVRVAVQRGDLRAVLVAPGRQHDGDGLAAHRVQLDGQPVREAVVTADHHVLGALSKSRVEMKS